MYKTTVINKYLSENAHLSEVLIMEIIERTTKLVGMVTAVFAVVVGGYTAWDKISKSFTDKDIIKWAPEHFKISDGPASGEFQVMVARQKLRDDCKVENFELEVRDSNYIVHTALPSIAKFSGPAGEGIEKFGYLFTIDSKAEDVAKGQATLLAQIDYQCPEGAVVVSYPNHANMNFNID